MNNTKTITLSHKIQIIPHQEDWQDVKYILRDIQDEVNKIKNRTVYIHWGYDAASDIARDMYNERLTVKEFDREVNNLLTFTNRRNKSKFVNTNGEVIEQCARDAISKYNTYKDKLIKEEGFIPSFGSCQPIPIKNTAFNMVRTSAGYIVSARLLSKEYAEKLHVEGIEYSYIAKGKKINIKYSRPVNSIRMEFKLIIKGKDRRTKEIVNKCISGEYKQGSSSLYQKDGKWYLILTYTLERKEDTTLNDNKILGVDMGIVYPAYLAISNSFWRDKIEGGEIEHFRKKTEARKRSILKQSKHSGEGRVGHGRKTRLKPTNILSDVVSNFRNTCNHKYSKFIVECAVKQKCRVIQMEDLSGIDKDNSFLKNWSYYDLQQKIKYKAEEIGIEVKFIKPKYTSQRCSECGFIHSDNRPKEEKGQSYFKCVQCGFETNADYNAAKNIATPNIEKIIEEQMERQEDELNNALKYEA